MHMSPPCISTDGLKKENLCRTFLTFRTDMGKKLKPALRHLEAGFGFGFVTLKKPGFGFGFSL